MQVFDVFFNALIFRTVFQVAFSDGLEAFERIAAVAADRKRGSS